MAVVLRCSPSRTYVTSTGPAGLARIVRTRSPYVVISFPSKVTIRSPLRRPASFAGPTGSVSRQARRLPSLVRS